MIYLFTRKDTEKAGFNSQLVTNKPFGINTKVANNNDIIHN